ncbi:hypothetical protein D3C72_2105560 [compost metagenome]
MQIGPQQIGAGLVRADRRDGAFEDLGQIDGGDADRLRPRAFSPDREVAGGENGQVVVGPSEPDPGANVIGPVVGNRDLGP